MNLNKDKRNLLNVGLAANFYDAEFWISASAPHAFTPNLAWSGGTTHPEWGAYFVLANCSNMCLSRIFAEIFNVK